MTTIYSALYDEMRDDIGIAAIVGAGTLARIFPGIPPPDATAPFISFRRINYLRLESFSGPSTLAKPTFQIDCWGSSNESMVALSEAVRGLLDGFRGDMGSDNIVVRRAFLIGQNDDPEDPSDGGGVDVNRNRMNFDIWHIE
jgi:hypothetical protein